MSEDINFKKNFIWNILGTGLNAFNSLFFLIIVTRINGIEQAGIFTLAFSTACILYFIGVYAGRIYQVTENNKKISDNDYIVSRIVTVIIMMIAVVGFVLVKGYDSYKSTIFILLTLFKAIEAYSDVLYGVMQRKGVLYKVGQSYFIKSLLGIIVFFIADFILKDIIISSILIIIVWIIVTIFFDTPYISKNIKFKLSFNKENLFNIFKNGFFIFAIAFLGNYILNAPKYAIDNLLNESFQTIFGIIVMPATVISLFGQFLIHPYLNDFTKSFENKDFTNINKLTKKIIIYIILFGIISSILAYFVGIPVLQLIYGVDLGEYRLMLTIIIVASTLYNVGIIYSNVLTTMRKTVSQFVLYLIETLIAVISSAVLTNIYGISGSVIAYFTIMFTLFIMYLLLEKITIIKYEKGA